MKFHFRKSKHGKRTPLAGMFAFLVGMAVLASSPTTALADVIIGNGTVFLGINDEGHLNVGDYAGVANDNFFSHFGIVGLAFKGVGDATSPGCLCEGWGVSGVVAGIGISGYANADLFPSVVNLVGVTLVSDADPSMGAAGVGTFATSTVGIGGTPLIVTQAYAGSGATTALLENKVTITNTSGTTVTDVRYTRVMDWDIAPTEFSEYVTIGGTSATNLLFSSNNAFNLFGDNTANPLGPGRTENPSILAPIPCGLTVDFTDCGPQDHGALFDFGFGDLAAGESVEFSIFYGAAETEEAADAALAAVGAEVFSYGQSSATSDSHILGTPATFIFAFKGVGGDVVIPSDTNNPIPEPGTILLMGTGLVGLVGWRLKKKD